MPTFQRPAQLSTCLGALAALDYPKDRFEVVLVHDGDAGAESIHDMCPGLALTVVHQQNAGPAVARNTGAMGANGEILAFTDDDCRPDSSWLRRLATALASDPSCLVGGRTVNDLSEDVYAVTSQLLVDFLYEHYKGKDGQPQFFTSNNMAMSSARFAEVGGFDPTFPRAAGEDRDFCDHWQHLGGQLRFVPEAVVHHSHHLTLRHFWNQHFGYGTGAWRFRQARARRDLEPVRVEPLKFYARLLGYPFRRGLGARAVPVATLTLLSQVANTAGYFQERRRLRAIGSPNATARDE